MIDKNPYEKDDVNVPNFGDAGDKENEPIFNMDTTSVMPETDTLNIEEEAESSSKVAIVVLIILLVLFLVGAVAGLLFGFSKSKEVSTVMEEYDAYKVKTQKQINDLETQVSTLTAENAELKSSSSTSTGDSNSSGTSTQTTANTYYLMDADIKVRTGAGTSYDVVNYDKLPSDIKDLVIYNKDTKAVTTKKAKFPVYETKQEGNNLWGRIADNAWVCIKYGNEEWGKKQ